MQSSMDVTRETWTKILIGLFIGVLFLAAVAGLIATK